MPAEPRALRRRKRSGITQRVCSVALLLVWPALTVLGAQGRDVRQAIAAGVIEMEASGGGLTGVWLLLHNKGDSRLDIVVPAGVYFRNRGSNQDMLTVASSTVSLAAGESIRLLVRAACATAHRGAPTLDDRFDVADTPAAAESFGRLSLASLAEASIQVALWVFTDDITLEFLKTRYTRGPLAGIISGPPAASDTDIAAAISALRAAGIDLAKHRICVREGVAVPEGATGFASLDAARALEESAVGKALKAQFQETARKQSAELDNARAELERAQQRLRADGPDARLEREIQRLQVHTMVLERDLRNQQTDLLAAFEKKATSVIELVLRDRRVVWSTPLGPSCAGSREALVDITDDVVRRLNSSGR